MITLIGWLFQILWLAMVSGLLCAIWINRHYPEQKAIIERAEQQHRWLMEGDDRGLYGEYPPANWCGGTLINEFGPIVFPATSTPPAMSPN